jgi:hypothetical protein
LRGKCAEVYWRSETGDHGSVHGLRCGKGCRLAWADFLPAVEHEADVKICGSVHWLKTEARMYGLNVVTIVTCEGGFGEQEDSPKPFLGRGHTRRRLLPVTRRPVHGALMSHCATPPGPWFATGHADEPPRQLQKILLGPPPQSHAARFPPRPLNAGLEAAYLFGDVTFAMLPPFCFVLQHGLLFFSNPPPAKHLGTLAGDLLVLSGQAA